jgi:RNA polymerase sigma factor (sigma-70 family)
MTESDHQTDLKLAQETCDELRSGNKDAILPVYKQYHPFLLCYTRKRLSPPDKDRVESILTDFWVELLNATAICSYKGIASLKTYLFKILKFRIIDNVRKASQQKAYHKNISDKEHDLDQFGDEDSSPEKGLMQKDKVKIVHETLLMMTEDSPKDAFLVKMHLEGLDYQQMAEKQLGEKDYTPKELSKKVNAIKKQFTRSKTGSLAKFQSYLNRCLAKNQLAYADLMN